MSAPVKIAACCLLCLVLLSAPFTWAQEGLQLVHADSLVLLKTDKGSVQRLYGHVRMVQEDAYMRCGRAVFWQVQNRAHFEEDVVIFDGEHTLWADQVDYDGEAHTERATGNVKIRTGDRLLFANRVMYDQETLIARAQGDVRIEDWIQKAVLTGLFAEFDRSRDTGWIRGEPVLVMVDSTESDTLRIRGEKMEGWGETQRVQVTDSVRIEKGGLTATSQAADYWADSSLIVLTAGPFVSQEQREMTGDTIRIELAETRFRGGEILGRARVVSSDSTSRNWIAGRRIEIEADGDTLRKVIVTRQAESRFFVREEDGGETGLNTVTGDRIEMRFDSNRVSWVQVKSDPGLCTGRYEPVDPDTVNINPGPNPWPRP